MEDSQKLVPSTGKIPRNHSLLKIKNSYVSSTFGGMGDITFTMLNLMRLCILCVSIDSIFGEFTPTFPFFYLGRASMDKKFPLFEYEIPVFRKAKAVVVDLLMKYDR